MTRLTLNCCLMPLRSVLLLTLVTETESHFCPITPKPMKKFVLMFWKPFLFISLLFGKNSSSDVNIRIIPFGARNLDKA